MKRRPLLALGAAALLAGCPAEEDVLDTLEGDDGTDDRDDVGEEEPQLPDGLHDGFDAETVTTETVAAMATEPFQLEIAIEERPAPDDDEDDMETEPDDDDSDTTGSPFDQQVALLAHQEVDDGAESVWSLRQRMVGSPGEERIHGRGASARDTPINTPETEGSRNFAWLVEEDERLEWRIRDGERLIVSRREHTYDMEVEEIEYIRDTLVDFTAHVDFHHVEWDERAGEFHVPLQADPPEEADVPFDSIESGSVLISADGILTGFDATIRQRDMEIAVHVWIDVGETVEAGVPDWASGDTLEDLEELVSIREQLNGSPGTPDELEAVKNELDDLREQREHVALEYDDIEQYRLQLEDERDDILDQLEELSAEYEAMEATIEDIEIKLVETLNELEETDDPDEEADLEEQIDQLEMELDDAMHYQHELEADIHDLEAELEDIAADLDAIDEYQAGLQDEYEQLSDEIAELEDEKAELQESDQDPDQSPEDLEERAATLESALIDELIE